MFKKLFIVAFGVAFGSMVSGCAQFKNTVGCYAGSEFGLGYEHNFGDSSGGGFSGELDPAHGKHGASRFRFDQADQFSEDKFETDVRVSFAPGACR